LRDVNAEIEHQSEADAGGVEGDPVEQAAQAVMAALNIADRVGTHVLGAKGRPDCGSIG